MGDDRARRDLLEAHQVRIRALEAKQREGVDEAALAREYRGVLDELDAQRVLLAKRRDALDAAATVAEAELGRTLTQQPRRMSSDGDDVPRKLEEVVGVGAGLGGAALLLLAAAWLSGGLAPFHEGLVAGGALCVGLGMTFRQARRRAAALRSSSAKAESN